METRGEPCQGIDMFHESASLARRALTAFATLFFASALMAGPQPSTVVSIEVIAREGLMPTSLAPDRNGLVVQVPYLKLYVSGELVFAGMPSAFDRLPAASNVRSATNIDAAIKVRRFAEEARLLKLKHPGSTGTVLMAYVYDLCPPCDNLIDGAVRQLAARGYGQVEQIRITAQ